MPEECPHGLEPYCCSICLHGPTVNEPVRVESRFTARYGGECSDCGLPISPGQRVARLSSGTYVHEGTCEP